MAATTIRRVRANNFNRRESWIIQNHHYQHLLSQLSCNHLRVLPKMFTLPSGNSKSSNNNSNTNWQLLLNLQPHRRVLKWKEGRNGGSTNGSSSSSNIRNNTTIYTNKSMHPGESWGRRSSAKLRRITPGQGKGNNNENQPPKSARKKKERNEPTSGLHTSAPFGTP